jgi:hypothetical protein
MPPPRRCNSQPQVRPKVSTGATQTGARFYFVDESQVVRFNLGGAATSGSTAIGN